MALQFVDGYSQPESHRSAEGHSGCNSFSYKLALKTTLTSERSFIILWRPGMGFATIAATANFRLRLSLSEKDFRATPVNGHSHEFSQKAIGGDSPADCGESDFRHACLSLRGAEAWQTRSL
jgi:hypothetical protein